MSEHDPEVLSTHYRHFNPVCLYCSEPATILRVTLTNGGIPVVASLCEKDATGEREHTTSGMENIPGTGDSYNIDGLEKLATRIANAAPPESKDA